MVAYSFKRRFVDPILEGTKRQTIRADRRRHARPGEELQLYTAMRTKSCRLIAKARCLSVEPVLLFFIGPPLIVVGTVRDPQPHPDDFAMADGFADWGEMHDFWRTEHFDPAEFEGVIIKWEPLS